MITNFVDFRLLDLQESGRILWKMYLLLSTSNEDKPGVGICLYGKQIDNVVGPFHPAIGELVRDRLFLENCQGVFRGNEEKRS